MNNSQIEPWTDNRIWTNNKIAFTPLNGNISSETNHELVNLTQPMIGAPEHFQNCDCNKSKSTKFISQSMFAQQASQSPMLDQLSSCLYDTQGLLICTNNLGSKNFPKASESLGTSNIASYSGKL